MRMKILPTLVAACLSVLVGCVEGPRPRAGLAGQPALDSEKVDGSRFVPGAIPPVHATDAPGGPPGSGLTK